MIPIKFQHSHENWLKLSSSVNSFERFYISLEKVFGMLENNIPFTEYELQTILSEPIGIFYIPLRATWLPISFHFKMKEYHIIIPPPPSSPHTKYLKQENLVSKFLFFNKKTCLLLLISVLKILYNLVLMVSHILNFKFYKQTNRGREREKGKLWIN